MLSVCRKVGGRRMMSWQKHMKYIQEVGKNSGSSSGSKRSRENDASDSNSVGSSVRPMGRDAAKKR
uniref:Uncharacterized protein n=1 Tax=Brassica oleracea var. oleracea TaxID=109376 RepID=A0A0D3CTU1_BRAOL